MNLREAVEARLRSQVTALREVGGAASMDRWLANRIEPPSAIVIPDRDTPEDVGSMAIERVFVTRHLAVITATRAVRDPRGLDGADECLVLREAVRDALLGWPGPALDDGTHPWEPMRFGGGQFWSADDGLYVWRDLYTTRILWTQAAGT